MQRPAAHISLPDRNGIEVLKQIKDDKPDLAVLMLSMHREDQYAVHNQLIN